MGWLKPSARWVAPLLLMIILVAAAGWLAARRTGAPPLPVAMPWSGLLTDAEGAAAAAERPVARPLVFPADQGAHPDSRGELWGLFGRLVDDRGARYAVQLRFVRAALQPVAARRESAWAARDLYGARLLVVPDDRRAPRVAERAARDALGLAGATPQRLWVAHWGLKVTAGGPSGATGWSLRLEEPTLALDLALAAVKPSRPFAELLALPETDATNAAAMGYLVPRLSAQGTLRLGETVHAVTGQLWSEHLWGTIGGARGQIAPSRLVAQLDDDRELFCLIVRRRDDSGRPVPRCALIHADGAVQTFQRREILFETAAAELAGGVSAAAYPLPHRLEIPGLGLRLRLEPRALEQGLVPGAGLWSGLLRLSGTANGAALEGIGQADVPALQAAEAAAR